MGDPPASGPCEAPGKAKPLHNGGSMGNCAAAGQGGGWWGSLCSVVGVSGGEGMVLGGSQHLLSCLQPIQSCSVAQSTSPGSPHRLCGACRSGNSSPKSVVRRKCLCPLPPPTQTTAAALAGLGVQAGLDGGLCPPASPPAAQCLSVSPSSPSPALLRQAGGPTALERGWSSLPQCCFPSGGAKSKPNVSSKCWQPWEAVRVGQPHELRTWPVGLGLVAVQHPSAPRAAPNTPGSKAPGWPRVHQELQKVLEDSWRERGCCEQAAVWQS